MKPVQNDTNKHSVHIKELLDTNKHTHIRNFYFPKIYNDNLYFIDIFEHPSDIYVIDKKFEKNNKTINIKTHIYDENSITHKYSLDIITVNITEDNNSEELIFRFVTDKQISLIGNNKGKFIISENNITIREFNACNNNNHALKLLLKMFIE